MTGMLTVTDQSYRYGRRTVLDHVTVAVPASGRHARIGASRAGTTALLGVVIHTGLVRRARYGIARTFQPAQLLDSCGVLENHLVVGSWRRTRSQAPRWAAGRYQKLAHGVSPRLERVGLTIDPSTPAGRLWHGQRRLLELAVAVAPPHTGLSILDYIPATRPCRWAGAERG
jgi:branched-chain amino acid transport system ATP-binding protein